MAPKLLWITIIHVLFWNFIFSLSESVELNEDDGLLLNKLRDRVRYTTHICDRLKNSPLVVNNNNYEYLPNSDRDGNSENTGLAKDLSEPSNPIKRHAILRCYNRPVQENNGPNKPDLISSEWQMKSTPDLYEHSVVQKSKVLGQKKIDIDSQKVIDQEPLYHTGPFLQKENLTEKNPKHSLLQLNLQDMTKKVKSLISKPQHKLGEIISDKIVDESLHNKLGQPSLTHSLPPKLTKYPVVKPLIRPAENILTNVESGLIADSDKQTNPLKLPPLLPQIPNNNFYQKDFIIENKPFLSFPSIQLNKPKPVEVFYDKRVPPVAYWPTLPPLIRNPVTKPTLLPTLVQKEVSIPTINEQASIGLLPKYPKIIKNGIFESTSQPILIEKNNSIYLPQKTQQESIDLLPTKQFTKPSNTEIINKPITVIEKKVSIYLPYKKQQELIGLLPPKQFNKTPDTKPVLKPSTVEKEVSISVPKEQEQQIIDLPSQAPQIIQTPDKESIYQETPGQTIVSVNAPYDQNQSTISLSLPPQINEPFNSESTSQTILSGNGVSISSTYGQQQPIINYSAPPQPQQINVQNEISTPLPYKQQITIAPLNLANAFNTELLSKKKISLYDQQQPLTLPSPPPLTKTTTSAYDY